MQEISSGLYVHPNFEERGRQFLGLYNLVAVKAVGDEEYSKRSLRGYTNRTCLFCGKSYPDAQFSSLSHLLPKAIGNTNMYSDFECDNCNARFSSFEDDLVNFLGVGRSFAGMEGEGRTWGFNARRLSAKSRSFMGENVLVIAPEDIEVFDGVCCCLYTKNTYRPSRVYRALLKSALSLLGVGEVTKSYQFALLYLMEGAICKAGLTVGGYNLAFQIAMPLHVYLFRKKRSTDRIHTEVIVFHFQNKIISLPVPFHREDMPLASKDFQFILPPPLFFNPQDMEVSEPQAWASEFAGEDAVVDEQELLIISRDPSIVRDLPFYDPETDSIKSGQPDLALLKHVIISRKDYAGNLKELWEFINEQDKK
jgi:hypothetical protein